MLNLYNNSSLCIYLYIGHSFTLDMNIVDDNGKYVNIPIQYNSFFFIYITDTNSAGSATGSMLLSIIILISTIGMLL